MKILPIGITYATWSGVGIVALSLIGILKYKQIPNLATTIGLAFNNYWCDNSKYYERWVSILFF